MAKALAAETADEPKALEAKFFKTLSGANTTAAKAGTVEAFKASLAECKRAGLKPWRGTRDPLEAAQEFMLTKAEKIVGQAVPQLWREQARELRAELGYDSAPALEKALIEHVVLCWLRLGETEIRYSAVTLDNSIKTHARHHPPRSQLNNPSSLADESRAIRGRVHAVVRWLADSS